MSPIDALGDPPALVRVAVAGAPTLGLWSSGRVLVPEAFDMGLDALLTLPASELRELVSAPDGRDVTARVDALLAPVASQEVWAAGVTYLRSRDARIEESDTGDIYDRVYTASRPELFFKATGWRVAGPRAAVGVRSDSSWNVPEPELAVLANAHGEIVAYGIGNDMSSRSIEGENPLYLPQAKMYDGACALGPAATFSWEVDPSTVHMSILRDEAEVFSGSTSLDNMVRRFDELVSWLTSHYRIPDGAWLLTGTGIVPDDDFTLRPGDRVSITIDGLGQLENPVELVGTAR